MATVTTLRLTPADNGRRLTLDAFLDAEEQPGHRYELAQGVLEVTQVPDEPHGNLVWFLVQALVRYADDHRGRIQRVGEASSFRLWLPGMVSGRNPDLAVVLENAPRDHRNRRVPALAFEVVSEGAEARHRDYVTKRAEYLAYGLFEYWIVDPLERTITVLTRQGDVWADRVFQADQSAEGLVLPGFRVTLPFLWQAASDDEPAADAPGA
jgi:Uma2 family endonuclease